MINKLKLLSDSKELSTNGLQANRFVYPFYNFSLTKDGRLSSPPMPQISCAMVDMATQINGMFFPEKFVDFINHIYQSGSEVGLQYNLYYSNSKQLMDILIDCEKNSKELPVVAFIKGWLWVGFEEDLRYAGAKTFTEWHDQ